MDLSGCLVYQGVGGDTGGQEPRGGHRETDQPWRGEGGEGRATREDSL